MMKKEVFIVGVGMTQIKKQGPSYEDLCREAIAEAMADAGLDYEGEKKAIEAIYYGNCTQGLFTSQHSVRGQVITRRLGFSEIPVINIENACATASTALHEAVTRIRAGMANLVLAVGVEKMFPDMERIDDFPEIKAALPYLGFASFWIACEQDRREKYMETWRREKAELLGIPYEETSVGGDRSPFMDYYAIKALYLMKKYGYTQEDLARVCAKTHFHGSLNPKAQYRKAMTWEEVLSDKLVTYPLTRPMCSPIGEGAAAALVCSEEYLKQHRIVNSPVLIRASVLISGRDRDPYEEDISARGARFAFTEAGLTPQDIDVLEVHDATSFGEIYQTAQAGFVSPEEAGKFCTSGETSLTGSLPTNTSGGLVSRGHPVGCTGLAQVYEIVTQLRHRAGERQVSRASIGMCLNGGGVIGAEEASFCAHIFEAC
ncbi:MAG: thiolase family protein [Syntrophales bacterium]|nr:thiolase family protein [Syntrophales bacterium]